MTETTGTTAATATQESAGPAATEAAEAPIELPARVRWPVAVAAAIGVGTAVAYIFYGSRVDLLDPDAWFLTINPPAAFVCTMLVIERALRRRREVWGWTLGGSVVPPTALWAWTGLGMIAATPAGLIAGFALLPLVFSVHRRPQDWAALSALWLGVVGMLLAPFSLGFAAVPFLAMLVYATCFVLRRDGAVRSDTAWRGQAS